MLGASLLNAFIFGLLISKHGGALHQIMKKKFGTILKFTKFQTQKQMMHNEQNQNFKPNSTSNQNKNRIQVRTATTKKESSGGAKPLQTPPNQNKASKITREKTTVANLR